MKTGRNRNNDNSTFAIHIHYDALSTKFENKSDIKCNDSLWNILHLFEFSFGIYSQNVVFKSISH